MPMTNRVRRLGPGPAEVATPFSSPPPPPPYAYVEEHHNGACRWTSAANAAMPQLQQSLQPMPPPPMPVAVAPWPQFAHATSPPLLPPPQPPQQQQVPVVQVPAARVNAPPTTIFSGRFTLLDCLGSGGFGDVFRAEERDQGIPLAVKVEQVTEANSRPDQSFLFHEAKVLQDIHKSILNRSTKLKADREARLQRSGQREGTEDPTAELNPDTVGIAKLKYYGQDGMQRVLIMSLHGQSVETVHRRQRRLSLYATVMIADQVLRSLEHVHRAGYVHADLKPDNILFGRSDPEQLYLVDFGLSVRYRDREGKHRPLVVNHSFVGTPRYASLRTHMGYTLSRRDDIEQLVYVMIYLFRGRLPWSGLRIDDPDKKEKHIAHMKANIPLDAICAGCPEAFRDVLNYARFMAFEEEPEYEYLHLLLLSLREACTSGTAGEVLPIPAPPAKETQQQQQQAPRNTHVNAPVVLGKQRESAAVEEKLSNLAPHPDIVSKSGNEVECGGANPLQSPCTDESPGIFSDAIGQGILSGNGTDAGPLSPRIDCLDGGKSPKCLPLPSPATVPFW